jgi:sodium/hydrogen exchanger 8
MAIFLEVFKSLYGSATFQPSFLELLTFGALISATDPVSTLAVFQAKQVDPHLFYLVSTLDALFRNMASLLYIVFFE